MGPQQPALSFLPVSQPFPYLSLTLEQLTGVFFYRGAGTGGLGLAIEGPSEAKMSCKDNKDGSCTVEYIPFTPGDYDVNITFGGQPIPGGQSGWGGLWEEGDRTLRSRGEVEVEICSGARGCYGCANIPVQPQRPLYQTLLIQAH